MATKEDILEQIVEEFLIHRGYFVRHNIKFLPRKSHPDYISQKDSNHSDIDVIGYHPNREGIERVFVVSCKSWQAGFNVQAKLEEIEKNKKVSGRQAWQAFRELASEKWTEGFFDSVRKTTGTEKFTYVLAVTRVDGDKSKWELHEPFRKALRGNPLMILSLQEMVEEITLGLTNTLAATEVGRMLQLFKSAGIPTKKA
jgi:hypothetical protein